MNKIKNIVAIAHPELMEDLQKTEAALSECREWLAENALTEDPAVAAQLIAKQNQEIRLKGAVKTLFSKQQSLMTEAEDYWNTHHRAENAADGITAIEAILKAIKEVPGKVAAMPVVGDARRELESVLKERNNNIVVFENVDAQSSFTGTLPVIKKS